jgi:hypothetical protein
VYVLLMLLREDYSRVYVTLVLLCEDRSVCAHCATLCTTLRRLQCKYTTLYLEETTVYVYTPGVTLRRPVLYVHTHVCTHSATAIGKLWPC